jgi:NADH:ubiquinone oxidoreductase subunit E
MPLETEATVELRGLVADLKPDDADLLEALHRVQHRYGYVSAEAMAVVGEQLRLSPAHVYGATTFYSELRTTPPPAHTIAWCSGASCLLKNSQGLLRALEAVLECPLGGVTADRSVELIRGQCNGTCEQAPQIWLDGDVVGRLTAAQAVRVARALRGGADAAIALAGIDGMAD